MKKYILLFTIILSLFVFVGCSAENTTKTTDIISESGNIEIMPSIFDFGEIDRTQGEVSTTVIVENVGEEILNMNRLSTSCGCTTAEMDMSDLAPGESREMVVTFDPMTHPDLTGPVIRIIYLQTSDSVRPEIEIELTGNVI
ncbi:MAG: DUF1573 domain-containing protein [Candidatus Peregrinibacteria bacterium]|nr:DUF1573 domain-containing protein [Candidatus Peregrinibacteria bacterium]